jgi:PTS system cellobiose-specific IIC component
MDSFVLMGGSGACFSLAIALAVAGRTQRHRKLGVSSIAPTAVNISETIIFGLPIVFNPFFALPFILAPAANYFVAYLAVSSGFMPPAVYIVPWTTPPLLSGFLVTGWAWQGAAGQAVNILLSAVIYTPFVLIFTSRGGKKEKNG